MKNTNKKELDNRRFDNLFASLERKIDQLNKEEKNNKNKEKPSTIEIVCSQEDIERTAKR